MSSVERTALVVDESTTVDYLAAGVIGVGLVAFVASWLTLFQWLDETASVLGVSLFTALGALLGVMGLGVIALGLGSRYGVFAAEPSTTAGLLVGVLFGLAGFVIGGLIASQTVGLGTTGWLAAAVLLGVIATVIAVLPREDVGSTLPAGSFLLFVSGVVVTGVIDTTWTWSPSDLSMTFIGPVVVPTLVVSASLVGSWSAAKARAGFGARGRQNGAYLLVLMSIAGMLATLLLLVGFIVVNGVDTVLTGAKLGGKGIVSLPFLTNVTKSLFVEVPGVFPAVVGTLWLVAGAIAFAVPLGVGAAVFITEYADRGRFTQLVEVATNGLWSTPSIVFGLFGIAFIMPRISNGRRSLLAGMVVLGFMLLPLVVITSRESIKAVPTEYREASVALGVSKWQTIRSVVLPSAMPGVITGIILGVGRIAGETAPLILVYGGPPYPNSNPNVLGSFEFTSSPPFVTNPELLKAGSALPYQLYTSITSGLPPGEAFTAQAFGWGTALVLLVVVLGLYAIGIVSRLYFRRKLHHE
ncbi:phosphate ABC transporter permease PstA [Haladaptatus sp. DYF46]|uniref:phosphate ABC transporter permease PstA n=1 Tax=Haladaptatus sp. DYF46 TaxID=2886041 RepID=UPI001E401456|nr:phosphate ABC transporter permease PstA [Haladaptatus sp. DYF46]